MSPLMSLCSRLLSFVLWLSRCQVFSPVALTIAFSYHAACTLCRLGEWVVVVVVMI